MLDNCKGFFDGLLIVDRHGAFLRAVGVVAVVVLVVMMMLRPVGDDRLVMIVVVVVDRDRDGRGRAGRRTETVANLTLDAVNGRREEMAEVVAMVVVVLVMMMVLVDVDVKRILAVRRA